MSGTTITLEHPRLQVLDGGQLPDEQVNREWKAAWSIVAEACERALAELHPLHPRRDTLLRSAHHARRAAALPLRLRAAGS